MCVCVCVCVSKLYVDKDESKKKGVREVVEATVNLSVFIIWGAGAKNLSLLRAQT